MGKINMEKDPKIFWQEIHRMLGHKKTKTPSVLYNEHNKKLSFHIEVIEAFRHRLYNTFRISDNDNLAFSQDTEETVNRWYQESI